jgi:hypothetical protein
VPVELVERQRPLALGRAQLHACDEPAEVPVSLARFDEHGQPHHGRGSADRDRQFGPDDRLQTGTFRRKMEARRAVDAVAIEQRERRIAERGGAVDQRLGERRAVEKRKGGRRVQLDVHGGIRH